MDTAFQSQRVEPWHRVEVSSVIATLHTSPATGLSHQRVEETLQKYGPNQLPESASRSRLSIFIHQFKSLPVALLSLAAGLSIATGGLADAGVIMGVVVINAIIGYTTENHSERIIHSLKHLTQPIALVLRDGVPTEINAQEVVPGDILLLKPGSRVAADARLIEVNRLSVDESTLTGESLPVIKTTAPLATPELATPEPSSPSPTSSPTPSSTEEIPLGDRTNMVYMGTLITGGQGLAVVVATGAFTEMGHIQALVDTAPSPETPMERQLDRAGSQLVVLSSVICGVVFGLGLLRGYDILQMLKTSIALAVAAVPEGLPAVATTTLALGIREMRQHNVLIRQLAAVETLGSVQVLCLDKTGTLTVNNMSVVELYADDRSIHVEEGQWTNGKEQAKFQTSDTLLKLVQVLVLCNESEINGNPSENVLKGSSTENALLELAIAAGFDVATMRKTYPRVAIQHRSETWNVMTTLHAIPEGIHNNHSSEQHEPQVYSAQTPFPSAPLNAFPSSPSHPYPALTYHPTYPYSTQVTDASPPTHFVAVKGNPNEVLSLCHWYMKAGSIVPLTPVDRTIIEAENDRMASKALRILGVAYRYTNHSASHGNNHSGNHFNTNTIHENLIWLGLVGMADPIRPGTQSLMHTFHQAGVETMMITGDQRSTAYAIGQALNLSHREPLQILDAACLGSLDPERIKALCEQVHVFARISPVHKLHVVQALQKAGKVVAMTGDGINDAPALKAADVGVAMGHVGTDVAREVADVVLEDDDLQTMTIALSRGRTIYNNIRKSVHFLLSTNLSEIWVMLIATAVGIGQPLNAMQLLWLNLVTDIFPGLALALEPPEPDVLSRPPRDPKEPIIQPSDFKRILFESAVLSASTLAAYGYAIARYGVGSYASTIAFMSLTCGQLFHALSCRSTTRRWGSYSRETHAGETHSRKTHALPPNRILTIALIGSLALQLLSAIVPGLHTLLHLTPIHLEDAALIGVSALLPLLVNEVTKPSEQRTSDGEENL